MKVFWMRLHEAIASPSLLGLVVSVDVNTVITYYKGGGGGGESMVWPSGKAFVRIFFGSTFSAKVVVCGHCLVTLSLTVMKH